MARRKATRQATELTTV